MLGVSTAYHHFVSGEYMKLIRRSKTGVWTLRVGMAVEIASVYYEKSGSSENVMAFYVNDDEDPGRVWQACWPHNKVEVSYHHTKADEGRHSPSKQMKVVVSSDSTIPNAPQDAMPWTYLYDPSKKTDGHTTEEMKHFDTLNLAGKFVPCWKYHDRLEDDVENHEKAYIPDMWRTRKRKENESARILLNPNTFLQFAPKGVYSYEVTDEYQRIHAGDMSATYKNPGKVESVFIPENEVMFSTVIMNGESFQNQKFHFSPGHERPLMPNDMYGVWRKQLKKEGYSIKEDEYQRTENSAGGDAEYENSMTMTISDNQSLHVSLPADYSTVAVGRLVLFLPTSADHWVLDDLFFKGYTIIIDQNAFPRKYKFIQR
ncbi:hypothetical protein ABG067_006573 [Albugo candida]